MKIKIEIDPSIDEPSITIRANEWTEELEALVKKIKCSQSKRLLGFIDEQSLLLDPNDIDFVVAENRKVFAVAQRHKAEIKMKLYEIEALLEPYHFTRFSKSVLGNLRKIERFELAFNGNLCVYFKSGNKEYVSRNYVNAMKAKLIFRGDNYDN